MTNVGIVGATGYTALELLRILLRHPEVTVTALTSRQEDAPPIGEIHPSLHGQLDLPCGPMSPTELAEQTDLVFCALPHGASMSTIPDLLAAGCRVVDLSADYRLSDPGIYEQWYGLVHTDPTRLGTTIYGLPELYRDQIPTADLVANPGCYTSTSILAIAPLLAGGFIAPTGIVIDAKSGISGAGRKPKLTTHFPECNEAVSAYSVGTHRHKPEIEQILSDASNLDVKVTFTPHLMPMDRGIFATVYATLQKEATEADLLTAMREFYADSPFVRVIEHLPSTKFTAHTNFCDLTIRIADGQLIILATTDNLIKGASGVAVQNFNLMCGYEETTALL